MAVFRVRRFAELYQRFIDYVVARAPDLNDANPGSNLAQIAGACARLVEGFYIETARLMELFSIYRARGADLDARAREYLPDGLEREGASRAVGTLQWVRAVANPSAVAIPAGAVVARTGTNPQVSYVTTAPGEIPALGTQSQRTDGPVGDIPARAVAAGAGGNAALGSVTKMVTLVAGATTVTNPTDFQGGRDEESDDSFRRRIIEHTRSLARSHRLALETRARATVLDGQKVAVAKVIHDAFNTARATLYVDDGSGAAETFDSTVLDETVIPSATGGERFFSFANRPLRDDAWTVTHTPNGGGDVVLVAGVDYQVVAPWGWGALSPASFPTGLGAGDALKVGPYGYYTGFLAAVQKQIDGDPNDEANFPPWVAAGVVVRVKPPVPVWMVVEATIVAEDGYDRPTLATNVKAAISAYINGLNVGDDVIFSELCAAAMSVTGVYDVRFVTPVINRPIGDNELARIMSANLTVT